MVVVTSLQTTRLLEHVCHHMGVQLLVRRDSHIRLLALSLILSSKTSERVTAIGLLRLLIVHDAWLVRLL